MKKEDTISIAEYKKLVAQHRIGNARKGDKAKREMKEVLLKLFDERDVKTEHRFSDRKFKFDFAVIPGMYRIKIAIEYEGLMSEKSGHTTVTGYTSNCDKYNLACILGWKVLRYTALNYKNLECDLRELF